MEDADAGASIPMLSQTHAQKERVTFKLLQCMAAGLLGAWQFGWASGAINMPKDVIERDLQCTNFEWSIIVAAFCVGGCRSLRMRGVVWSGWRVPAAFTFGSRPRSPALWLPWGACGAHGYLCLAGRGLFKRM